MKYVQLYFRSLFTILALLMGIAGFVIPLALGLVINPCFLIILFATGPLSFVCFNIFIDILDGKFWKKDE